MKKLMTNAQIWEAYGKLEKAFSDENIILPIKINYNILINKQELFNKYMVIEQMRQAIGKKYGEYDASIEGFNVPAEKREIAQQELTQLLEIDQSVEIILCRLEDLENLNLTMAQMDAILFMIEKEE